MGTFSTAQTAGALFCPQPRGQRTPSAPCRVHLQPCAQPRSKRISQRELLLSFTAEKLEGQKTKFVTHSWLPAGHSLLLHLLQHPAQAGSFSADCALGSGDPSESRTAPKTAMALLDPPSIPYPILTEKLEEMRLVLSLTKY